MYRNSETSFYQNRIRFQSRFISPHHHAQTSSEFHSALYKWVKHVNVTGSGETGVNLSQSRDDNSGFSETETPIGNTLERALLDRRET
jgi:hypothetical protein